MKKLLIIISALVLGLSGCDKSGSGSGLNSGNSGNSGSSQPVSSSKLHEIFFTTNPSSIPSNFDGEVTLDVFALKDGVKLTDGGLKAQDPKVVLPEDSRLFVDSGPVYEKGHAKYKLKLKPGQSGQTSDQVVKLRLKDESEAQRQIGIVGSKLELITTDLTFSSGIAKKFEVKLIDESGVSTKDKVIEVRESGDLIGSATVDVSGVATLNLTFNNSTSSEITKTLDISVKDTNDLKISTEIKVLSNAAPRIELSLQNLSGSKILNRGDEYDVNLKIVNAASSNTAVELRSGINMIKDGSNFVSNKTITVSGSSTSFKIKSSQVGEFKVFAKSSNIPEKELKMVFAPKNATHMTVSSSAKELNTNPGSATDFRTRAQISATLTDGQNGVPVQGRTVYFTVESASNSSVLATLLSSSAVTDGRGIATITVESTANPGKFSVRASLPDADPDSQTVNPTVDPVVVDVIKPTLGVSLGIDNKAEKIKNDLRLKVLMQAVVNDDKGNPVSGADVTIIPSYRNYYKGDYFYAKTPAGSRWIRYKASSDITSNTPITLKCSAEREKDANNTFIDTNGNGQKDPKSSVIFTDLDGNSTTSYKSDSNGAVKFYMRYLHSEATWTDLDVIVTATRPGAEKAIISKTTGLAGLVEDFKNEGDPPFQTSMYGNKTTGSSISEACKLTSD